MADAPSPSLPPGTRELRPPPYLLRTPDGMASYFDRENYRIIVSPQEPLSAFLAPAALIDEKTPGPGKARQRIEYDLSQYDAATFAPLEAVPASVVADFEAAARAFYERVDSPESKATDHERRLRRGFRLPDPDVDRDAYWLCGPRDDRRLLILWGCESKRGTALPLQKRADAGNVAGVLERLRSRGMPWAAMQKEAVALIVEKRRPLSSYLATPVRDRAGALTGVILQGKTIPSAKLKPLKHLSTGAIKAFEKEAAEFYAGVYDESQGLTGYEKELRLGFRVPDPEKNPEQYFSHGGRPLILINGSETPGTVICPGADATIPMPPEEKGPDGASFVPETLVDRLRVRATPVKQRAILAGAAAALVLTALLVFEAFADRTPPRIERVVAENVPTQVRIQFDEAVDPASLRASDAIPEPVRVRGPDGRFLTVSRVQPDPNDAAVVLLQVEPMAQGTYELVLRGVSDTSRKQNTIESDVTLAFEFRDTLPPVLEKVSAHPDDANRLVLIFNEPLDAASMRDRNNYVVPGFTLRSVGPGEEPSQVVLTVDKEFANRGRYSLTVQGVADRSGNPITAPVTNDFVYLDTIAPRLDRVEAVASQVRVHAHFTKRLSAGAANPSLYRIEASEGADRWSPVEIISARLPDDTKPVIELLTAPLKNGVVYRLAARDVPDRADPPNTLEAADPFEFRFTGREDTTPPGLSRPRVREGSNNSQIEVTFTEEVTPESALRTEAYSFVELATPIVDVTSADIAAVRVAILHLASPLPQGSQLTLRATGLVDLVGNANEEAISDQFWVSGIGLPWDTTLQITGHEVRANGSQIVLTFNEDLTARSAQNPVNFTVSGNRRVARTEWAANAPKSVTIVLDGSTPLTSGTFAVTASNLALAELPDFVQHRVTRSVAVP